MVGKKYIRVQNGIINLIASGNIAVGGALPTEKELAERFNVSIITIRRAVSNLEQMEMVERIQGSGTFVTSHIPGKLDNGNIVYLNICRDEPHFPFLESTSEAMGGSLLERGYHLQVLMAAQVPSSSVVQSLNEVRGVIATGWMNSDWIKVLNALSIPAVFLGSEVSGKLDIPSIDFDWRKMAEMLTAKLLSGGARKLGLIIGGEDYPPALLMRDGFSYILRLNDIDFDPFLIYYSDEGNSYAINDYLKEHDDLDGLLIERGCYIHVLNSLFNTDHRPAMAIMSSDSHNLSGVCESIVEAAFKENIYSRSVDLLMDLMESSKEKPADVKIEPYLCG